jgi:hypothetical protein
MAAYCITMCLGKPIAANPSKPGSVATGVVAALAVDALQAASPLTLSSTRADTCVPARRRALL